MTIITPTRGTVKRSNYKVFSMNDLEQFFNEGRFAIPNLQREFVWNANKATELAMSIYKKYPIGMILVWETKADKQLRRLHGILPPFNESNKHCWNLLDGQQRISVIYKFYNPSTIQNDRKQEIDFRKICFWAKENKFTYLKEEPDEQSHFSLTEILNGKYARAKLPIGKKEKLKKVKHTFENLKLPFCFIRENDTGYATEAFIRLNTKGTALKSADRVLANACNVKLRDKILNFKEGLPSNYDALENSTLIDAIVFCHDIRDISEQAKNNLIKGIDIESSQFAADWKSITNSVGKTITQFRNFGVFDMDLLPSKTMVSILSVFFYNNGYQNPTDFQANEIKKWFWITALGSRYSGRSYRKHILEDIEKMKKLAIKSEALKLKLEKIEKEELQRVDYSKNSTVAKAYFCLLSLMEPLYLGNGQRLNLENPPVPLDKLHKHHIFPKDRLIKAGIKAQKYNSIINICYLALQENSYISNKLPFEYLQDYRYSSNFKKIMKSHIIPSQNNAAVWTKDVNNAFRQFFKERTEEISRSFENVAGTPLFE